MASPLNVKFVAIMENNVIVCKIGEAEASLALIKIVELAGLGEWRIYEPCYLGAETEHEYEGHLHIDENNIEYFSVSSRAFKKLLEGKCIGFDWTDIYFFKNKGDNLCGVICQCIDGVVWIFRANINCISVFMKSSLSNYSDIKISQEHRPKYQLS